MENKILVVYYTHSSKTKKIAEIIKEEVNGDIMEIEPESPYPASYNDVVEQAKKEINLGYKPKIKNNVNIEDYNIIIIGSPNWWDTIAPPIATFLGSADFSDKIIAPFCTHGGGEHGTSFNDIEKISKAKKVLKGFSIFGSGGKTAREKVVEWLKEIGLK